MKSKIKKSISIIISFSFALNFLASNSMFEFTYASAEECDYEFVFGDIDGDGAINICDMILLKSYFTENNNSIDVEVADLDADGEVSNRDAIELSMYLTGCTGTFTNEMKVDTDNDGLNDYAEKEITHTDYQTPDTDGDGLDDYTEVYLCNTDPLKLYTKGSKTKDTDLDADGDGLTNGEEAKYGTSPDVIDTDEDGITDYDEIKGKVKSDPLKKDSDDDGVSDFGELQLSLNPMLSKTDGKIPDGSRYFEQKISEESLSEINTEDNFYKLSVTANMRGYAPETMYVTESSYSAMLEEYAVNGKVIDVIYPESYKDETGEFSLNLRFELKDCSNPEDFMIFKYLKDDCVALPVDTEWDGNTLCVNDTDAGTYLVVDLNAVDIDLFTESSESSIITDNNYKSVNTEHNVAITDEVMNYSYQSYNAAASKSVAYTCIFNLGSSFKVGFWNAGVREAVEGSMKKLFENNYSPTVTMIFKGSYGYGDYVVSVTCNSVEEVTKVCNEASSFFSKSINADNALGEYQKANTNLGGKLNLGYTALNYASYIKGTTPVFVFNENVTGAVCRFRSGGAVCSLLRTVSSKNSIINSVGASGVQKIYDIVTEGAGKTAYISSMFGKLLLKTKLTPDMILKYLSNKQMTAEQRKALGFMDTDDDGVDDALEIAMELIKVVGDKIVLPTFGDVAKKIPIVSKGIETFSEKKKISSGNVKDTPYIPQKQAVNNPDSDGDGLLDGGPIYYNGKIIAPKDPQPSVYNGHKNMWKKHIETAKSEGIPNDLVGWYGYTGNKNPDNGPTGTEGFIVLEDEIEILLKEFGNEISKTNFEKYMKQAIKTVLFNSEAAAESFNMAINELKSCLPAEKAKLIAAELGSAFLNFKVDNKNVLHSQYNQWQAIGGYSNVYDGLFGIFTRQNMDKFKLAFSSEHNEYIFWGWRGDYLNIGAGAEVGIYSRPSFLHQNEKRLDHYFVDKDLSMNMDLYLYDYLDENNITNNYSWEPTTKQWWVCGWNPKDAWNVDKNKLVIVNKIDMSDHSELFGYFAKEYENKYRNDKEYNKQYGNTLIVDYDSKTVWIEWGV